jgi:hypothetical protein
MSYSTNFDKSRMERNVLKQRQQSDGADLAALGGSSLMFGTQDEHAG